MTQNLSGTLNGQTHHLPVRVYFEDTDFSGIVYHARYLHFLERGRTDMLRLMGVHHSELKDGAYGEPLFFAVKTMQLDFKAAAQIDDVLIVETNVASIKGVRLNLKQVLLKDEKTILAADVEIVLINADGSPKRIPKDLITRLSG